MSDQTTTWDDAAWMDILKQFYHAENEMAADCTGQKDTHRAQIHRAKSAMCANLLAIYYRTKNHADTARLWEDRAIRQNQRAFGRNNKFVQSLGLEMP